MCLHSKGMADYGSSVILSGDGPGWWFIRPPLLIPQTNYGHESCFMLTAPFLTNADLCVHPDWLILLIFRNCLHASPQWTGWLWWVWTVFFLSLEGATKVFTKDNRKLSHKGVLSNRLVSQSVQPALLHGCIYQLIGSLAVLDLVDQYRVVPL